MTLYRTERGSTYKVKGDRWSKNEGSWSIVYWMKALKSEDIEKVTSWSDVDRLSEDRPPVVGERLYIGNRDTWWLSTPIVEVLD